MINVLYAMENSTLESFVNFKSDLDKIRSIATPDQIDKVTASVQELQLSTGQSFSFDSDTGIAIIPISGTLTPKPEICVSLSDGSQTLYSTIIESISQAEQMDSVKELHFVIDSPGGYVSGVDQAAISISKCTKPTKAIVTDMCASAAYWLASQCDEIIADTEIAQFGSIGVRCEVIDRKKADSERGITRYVLTSKNAPEKFKDVSKKEDRDKIVKELTDLESVFIKRVALGRNASIETVKSDFGRGDVFIAEDALKAGMIDKINNGFVEKKPKTSGNASASDESEENRISAPDVPGTINTIEEGNIMPTFQELLDQNPGAKEEYSKAIIAAEKKGQASINARIESAKPYLSSDKYPKTVSETAIKVITGEADVTVLTAAVAAVDSVREMTASNDAVAETGVTGDTPAQTQAKKSEDGVCVSNEDLDAEIARSKEINGGT